MPVFNYIGARGTEAKHNTPTRPLVQCGHSAGDKRGAARVNIGNARANLNPAGHAYEVGHRGKEFIAPGFAQPDRVIAQAVRDAHFFHHQVPGRWKIRGVGNQANLAGICPLGRGRVFRHEAVRPSLRNKQQCCVLISIIDHRRGKDLPQHPPSQQSSQKSTQRGESKADEYAEDQQNKDQAAKAIAGLLAGQVG